MSDPCADGIERLNQEEIDTLVGVLMDEPQTQVPVVSAVRKLDDIEAGPGELPDGFDIGCQKCDGVIGDGDEYTTRFGFYYCRSCIERIERSMRPGTDQ